MGMSNLRFLLLLVAHCAYLSAQNISEELNQPDQIYVIGESMNESGLVDAPVKLEVLSNKEIEEQQYQDLSEAITDLPGVNDINVTRRAGAKAALIQGFGENSVLVMIDGTPVSQNSSFGFDLTQVSTDDIEKVEVIKGGASALYGSQAIGGVINIVTKKPAKKAKVDFDLSTTFATEGDSAPGRNAKMTYSGSALGFGQKLSVGYRDQEAFDLDGDSLVQDGVKFNKLNTSLYIDRKWASNRSFLSYSGFQGKTTSTSSKPYGSSTFGEAINDTDTTIHNIKLGNTTKTSNGKFKILANLEKTQDDLNLNDNPDTYFKETYKETRFESRRGELIYDELMIGDHSLTFGALIKEDTVNQKTTTQAVADVIVETNDIENKKINTFEAYAQDSIFIGNFEISPGVRVQYDDNYGTHTSPKVNMSYFKDFKNVGTKTWVTLGTGYRAPSVKERFFTLDHLSVANYIVQGNEDLRPETSVSLQVGEELRFGKRFSIHTNLFYNQVKNLIETTEVETNSSNRLFTYKNFDKVSSHGVELGSKTKVTEKVNLKVNYTYSKTENETTGLILVNRPFYSGNVILAYSPTEALQLLGSWKYTGDKYTSDDNTESAPGFAITSLKLNYQVNKNLGIYAGLNNVFDLKKDPAQDLIIPTVDDRPAQGRTILTGLKVRGF